MLAALKQLRELRIAHNPISETPGLRYLLILAAPKIQRLDGLQVLVTSHDPLVTPHDPLVTSHDPLVTSHDPLVTSRAHS